VQRADPELIRALHRIARSLEEIECTLADIADEMPRENPLDRVARKLAEEAAERGLDGEEDR
jgi:hypothetical protein